MKKKMSLIAVVAVLGMSLAGCAWGSHGSGSRHELYDSLDQLVADSAVVVVVDVGAATETAGTDEMSAHTSYSAEVTNVLNPAGLGSSRESSTKFDQPVVGGALIVRQIGTTKEVGPGPMLISGETYLLFLIPTEIPGAGTDEYYIVGAWAGAFKQVDAKTFHAISEEDGDKLPADLTLDALK